MQIQFNLLPHKVIEKHGNKVTIESQDGVRYDSPERHTCESVSWREMLKMIGNFVLLQVHSDAKFCYEGSCEKSALSENSDKSKVQIPQQDISQSRGRSGRNIKPPIRYQDYVMNYESGF